MIATFSRFWDPSLLSSDLKKIMDLVSMVVEESLSCYKILIYLLDSVILPLNNRGRQTNIKCQ